MQIKRGQSKNAAVQGRVVERMENPTQGYESGLTF